MVSQVLEKSDNNPWNRGKQNDAPPNLDEILKKIQKFMNGKNKGGGGLSKSIMQNFGIFLVIIALLWFVTGFYIVKPANMAVVLRFGKYMETQPPGLHWLPLGVQSKYIVNIDNIEERTYSAEMLTKDENYVHMELAVLYRKQQPRDYLFNNASPELTLIQATASALRQIAGESDLETLLTTGKEEARRKVEEQILKTIEAYQTGLSITDVKLQEAKVPEQVIEAFDDAIRAREDQQKLINQGDEYEKKVVPIAQGKAKRIASEADAYQKSVILNAQGETARFNALLAERNNAPEITDTRLYLTTLNKVFSRTSKLFVKDSNQLVYLPIDKLKGLSKND